MTAEVLRIRTPEGIAFSLALAGPIPRFLAWTVDLACMLAAGSVLASVVGAFGVLTPDLATAALVLGYFALSIGYGMVSEWLWRGQTVGKRVLRLRVVDERGARLAPSQVVVRNLLRAVDSLPALYLVGGVAMLFSRYGQRLGDFAANTVVVRSEPQRLLGVERVFDVKYNSLREHPHIAARLRQRLTPQEATLGLRALLRRRQLSPEARVELFRRLADHYRSVISFPAHSVDTLADEQYVRNVIDVVLREG